MSYIVRQNVLRHPGPFSSCCYQLVSSTGFLEILYLLFPFSHNFSDTFWYVQCIVSVHRRLCIFCRLRRKFMHLNSMCTLLNGDPYLIMRICLFMLFVLHILYNIVTWVPCICMYNNMISSSAKLMICISRCRFYMMFLGPFDWYKLTLIHINHYIHYILWDVITYTFPNFNGAHSRWSFGNG